MFLRREEIGGTDRAQKYEKANDQCSIIQAWSIGSGQTGILFFDLMWKICLEDNRWVISYQDRNRTYQQSRDECQVVNSILCVPNVYTQQSRIRRAIYPWGLEASASHSGEEIHDRPFLIE